MSKYLIFGGGGKVALKFAEFAVKQGHKVISVVHNSNHDEAITSLSAQPVLLSLEDSSVSDIAELLKKEKYDGILFSAGSGGKGGEERTKKVDYEGALKVFDAMESSNIHRIVLISATDIRDTSKPYPEYYNEESKKTSDNMWKAIPTYMKYKRLADQDLYARKALRWTILRPGHLSDEGSDGKCQLGQVQLGKVSRETVARVALSVMENKETYARVWDLMDGDQPIEQAIDKAVESEVSSWHD